MHERFARKTNAKMKKKNKETVTIDLLTFLVKFTTKKRKGAISFPKHIMYLIRKERLFQHVAVNYMQ